MQNLMASGPHQWRSHAFGSNCRTLEPSRLKSLVALLGMFNTTDTTVAALEGSEDSGGIFQKKHHVLQILSVLGLTSLISLKGCDEDTTSNPSQMLMVFTWIFGFACLVFLHWFANMLHVPAAQEERDAEPIVMNDNPGADAATMIATAAHEPTADNYVVWLIGRCNRRRDSTTDHDRRRRYEERVAILRCLQSAVHSPVESLRVATLRTLGNMSDIS